MSAWTKIDLGGDAQPIEADPSGVVRVSMERGSYYLSGGPFIIEIRGGAQVTATRSDPTPATQPGSPSLPADTLPPQDQ